MSIAPWILEPAKLKHYPHFDGDISAKDAETLANDPKRVERHKFYPFLLFTEKWTRFAEKGDPAEKKVRPIRYAARGDAYIYARYRHVLAHHYENMLVASGLSDAVLAYRKIPSPSGEGMCNIHFAQIAFNEVMKQGNCCVIALDISSFFESIDHEKLKNTWCRLLGVTKLPNDHFTVFKNITQYAVVDKQAAYGRLGFFGPKRTLRSGAVVSGYLLPKTSKLKRLCTGTEFRAKIAGGNGQKSIIKKNLKPYGIPQGSPISDLLANMYLIDFDKEMSALATRLNGRYLRYSDDILIIAPITANEACSLESDIRKGIQSHGRKLVIKSKKSYILQFYKHGPHQGFNVVFDGQSVAESLKRTTAELIAKGVLPTSKEGKEAIRRATVNARKTLNGLEYLGFRFDGRKVYLRDSTLSNLWRRIKKSARRRVRACIRANPGCDAATIKRRFDYLNLINSFGRVEDFYENLDDHKTWTFWSYVQRASRTFGPIGSPILRQLRGQRRKIEALVHAEIDSLF